MNCELYKDDCTFVFHNDKRKPYPKEYIDALNSRIKVLENLLTESNVEFAPATDIPIHDDTLDLSPEELKEPPVINSASRNSDFLLRLSERQGGLSMTETGLKYFGATSNLHIMPSIVWTRRPCIDLATRGRKAVEDAGLEYDIPAHKRLHLLQLFWTWVHPFITLLDKRLFMKDMELYYRNEASNSHSSSTPDPYGKNSSLPNTVKYFSPLILNAILAMGSLLDDADDGHPYRVKARILLNIEMEEPQITTVQALALLGVVEAMSTSDTLGWAYSGLAMRIAVDMGFHQNPKNWVEKGYMTAEEANARAKTFWGCFSAERMWSFYLGRPSSLSLSDVMIPRPTEDLIDTAEDMEKWVPYSSPDHELPNIWREYTALHQTKTTNVYVVKLAEHMAEIQEVLFNGSDKYSQTQLWSFASQMHIKLSKWYTTLPSPLLCSPNSQKPVVSHIVLLHIQYHATVINLFKPFLHEGKNASMNAVKKESPASTSSVSSNISPASFDEKHLPPSVLAATHSADVCRNSALAISKLLSCHQHSWYGMRRIHPSAVQIAFTAAVIHLNNAWGDVGTDKINATQGLKACCEALAAMSTAYEASKRALSIVTCLMAKGKNGFTDDGKDMLAVALRTGGTNTPMYFSRHGLGSAQPGFSPSVSHLNLEQLKNSSLNVEAVKQRLASSLSSARNDLNDSEKPTPTAHASMQLPLSLQVPQIKIEKDDDANPVHATSSNPETRYNPYSVLLDPMDPSSLFTPEYHSDIENYMLSAYSSLANHHSANPNPNSNANNSSLAMDSHKLLFTSDVVETTWKPNLRRNLSRARMESHGLTGNSNHNNNNNNNTGDGREGQESTLGSRERFMAGVATKYDNLPIPMFEMPGMNPGGMSEFDETLFANASNLQNATNLGSNNGIIRGSATSGNVGRNQASNAQFHFEDKEPAAGSKQENLQFYGNYHSNIREPVNYESRNTAPFTSASGEVEMANQHLRANWPQPSNQSVNSNSSKEDDDGEMYVLDEHPRIDHAISNRTFFEYNMGRVQSYLSQLEMLSKQQGIEGPAVADAPPGSDPSAAGGSNRRYTNEEMAQSRPKSDSISSSHTVSKSRDNSIIEADDNETGSDGTKSNARKAMSDLLVLTTLQLSMAKDGASQPNAGQSNRRGLVTDANSKENVHDSSSDLNPHHDASSNDGYQPLGFNPNSQNMNQSPFVPPTSTSTATATNTNANANANTTTATSSSSAQTAQFLNLDNMSSAFLDGNDNNPNAMGFHGSHAPPTSANPSSHHSALTNSEHVNYFNLMAAGLNQGGMGPMVNPELSGTNEWRQFFHAVKKDGTGGFNNF